MASQDTGASGSPADSTRFHHCELVYNNKIPDLNYKTSSLGTISSCVHRESLSISSLGGKNGTKTDKESNGQSFAALETGDPHMQALAARTQSFDFYWKCGMSFDFGGKALPSGLAT